MEQRSLGNTGFHPTVIGYGAMELRHVDEQAATELLNAALDAGINYMDTSPDYGASEEFIGRAISHRRDEFILASKCGCNIDASGKGIASQKHIWSRAKLTENIERSLRLLRTDHLDVWQLHGPFPNELPGAANDDVIETMLELKRQGKVRAIGISFKTGGKTDPEQPPSGYGALAPIFLAWNVFEVMQIVYGGLVLENGGVVTNAANQGVGVVARGVARKYGPDYAEMFARARLDELCASGESMTDFLIRLTISHPGVSTLIIGSKNLAHIAANIRAANQGVLPAQTYAQAMRRLSATGIAAV